VQTSERVGRSFFIERGSGSCRGSGSSGGRIINIHLLELLELLELLK